jgi:hypothetical protein
MINTIEEPNMENTKRIPDILRPTGERYDIRVARGLTFVIDTQTDQEVTGRHYHSEFMARKVAAKLNGEVNDPKARPTPDVDTAP